MSKTCDQCEALYIMNVFCHETGCPNQGKTWDDEREEWIKYVECFHCGCDVEADTYCQCCVETGADPESDMELCTDV